MSAGIIDVFFDETGNTGDDFAQTDQPFFVLAGWVVPRTSVDAAVAQVRAIVERRQDPSAELKGSRMLRSPQGRELMVELVEGLLDSGCLAIVALYEKAWTMAAKLVAHLVDGRTNPRAIQLPADDIVRRDPLVEHLYRLGAEPLSPVWNALRRGPTVKSIHAPLLALLQRLHETSDQTLTVLLVGALRNLSYLADRLRVAKADPLERFWDAPNAAALAALLNNLDLVAQDMQAVEVHVCHDDTASFAATLRDAFELIVSGPEFTLRMNNGAVLRKGLPRIKDLTLLESARMPLLQAADVLATLVAVGARASGTGWNGISELQRPFERVIVAASWSEAPYFVTSQSVLERIISPELARAATARARERGTWGGQAVTSDVP